MFKNATAMDGRSSDLMSWKAMMLIAVLFISLIAVSMVADSTSADGESISVSSPSAIILNDATDKKTIEITVTVNATTTSDLSIKVVTTSNKITLSEPSAIGTDKKSKFRITGVSIGTGIPVTVKLMRTNVSTALDTEDITVTVKNVVTAIDIKDGSTKISGTTINMYLNTDKTVTADYTPSDAKDKSCEWKSDNTSVASITSSGKITAKATGTAKITVTSKDPDKTGVTNYITVKVLKKVDSVSVSPTSGTVKIGKTISLVATILPADASINTLNVTPDKTSMLKYVSQTPSTTEPNKVTIVLEAIGETGGTVNVTIATTDPGSTASAAHATITTEKIPVTGVDIVETSIELEVNEQDTLETKFTPDDATVKRVTWSSSDTKVFTVDSTSGVITAVSPGKAIITAKAVDNTSCTDTCEVTVVRTYTILADVDPPDESGKGQVQNVSKAIESIKKAAEKGLYPVFTIPAILCTSVSMTSDLVETIQDIDGGQMIVSLSLGEILFDEDAIDNIDTSGTQTGVSFTAVDKKDYPKFGDCYIYDISMLKDGVKTKTTFGSDSVKIGIYHELTSAEDKTKLIAAYVYGDGNAIKIKNVSYVTDEYDYGAVVIEAPHMSLFMFMFHESEYVKTAGIDTVIAIVFLVIIVILAAGIAFFTFNENASEKLQNLFKRNNTKRPPMSPPGQNPYGYYPGNQFNGYGNNYNNYNNNNGNNNYR